VSGEGAEDAPAIDATRRRMALPATVPVELEFPADMEAPLRAVLAGEYDAPLFGSGLTILDVGANVGAFTLWARMRWPAGAIHAYEPHPETFRMLTANAGHLAEVSCTQAAVYPGDNATEALISRHAGDGEAGLVEAMATTWRSMPRERVIQVPVVHPRELPRADIVKIDAEGSEGAIVEAMDLSGVSLLLFEYQNLENLARIERAVAGRLETVRHDAYPWRDLLGDPSYRPELVDDRHGTVVMADPATRRLRREGG
jgi:FkbM family methyltransferase